MNKTLDVIKKIVVWLIVLLAIAMMMPEIVDGKLQIYTDLEGEHGFGLYNVEKALRRNNGKISFRGIEKKDGKREIVTEIEV